MPTPSFTRPAALGVSAAILLAMSACNEAPQSTLADAQRAFDQRELRIARAHLADIFARGDADARTYLLQMRLMLEMGDGFAAMSAIDNLPESVLGGAERRVAIAHAHILQGHPHKAAELYEPLAAEDFTEQDFRMALWALRDMGKIEEFERGMDFAIGVFPDSPHLNAMAGEALIDRGQTDVAAQLAERAHRKDPDNFETLLLLGRVAIAQGKPEQALARYQQAAKRSPHNPVPPANIAGLQLDLGRVKAAGKTLERALADNPEFAFLQWQKARHALATDDADAARTALESARRTYRDNDAFTLLSAQVEEKSGNRKLALSEYRRYLRAVGSDPKVEAQIARLER